jgi:glycerate 2-kinase
MFNSKPVVVLRVKKMRELSNGAALHHVSLRTDGPTDAAGAIVHTDTLDRAMDMGLDPNKFLDENDSYHFFQKLSDLLIQAPRGRT